MNEHYGTLQGSVEYFDMQLHSEAWNDASPIDRRRALIQATRLIDALNYKGVKHTVHQVLYVNGVKQNLTDEQLIVADRQQPLEFPRGADTEVPQEIEWSCYEAAIELIEGFDPDEAMDQLNVIRQSYDAVRTTYAENSSSAEFIVYGIPTARIWRWLKPRLTNDRMLRLERVT